jgi:hypothetical protein
MRRPLRRSALLAALLALTACAPAAHAQIEVIETDDLRLTYPAPMLSFIAPYTARCFENSMRFHKKLWGYTPSDPVNVMLDDFTDYGNAGVWVNPRNSMVLHIAPSSFVYETGPSNERINFTMNHEVVHVLALDGASGADRMYRGFFHGKVRETSDHPETILYGNLTLPRRASPRWYHEGIATFMETWMAGGIGRAQGPYDEMVFRAMVRDSAHFYDPLGLESEGVRVDFQVGANSYLYGTRFMDYLAWEYGPEKLIEWVGRGPGSKRYFANQFQHVYGRSLSAGWNDWIAFEHEFQRANLAQVRQHPVTGHRRLSPLALGSVSRAYVDSTSRSILAAVFHQGALAHLAAIPLDGGPERVLQEVKGPALYFVTSLAFDPDGRKLFYTTDNNDWRDLREYDLATGKDRRLLHDARIGDLVYARASQELWGVRHLNGISALVRLAKPYDNWQLVWALPYGLDMYDLDVSPDGTMLAASFAEISGRQTLRLFQTAALAARDTSSRTLWDFGTAVPAGFTFDPSGHELWGSSYYTGVSNIFRYDLARDSMDVMSNAETGFFRPVPAGGDSLLVFEYTGQGFQPARILPRPLTDVSSISFLGERLAEKRPVLKDWAVPPPSKIQLDPVRSAPHPYSGLANLGMTTAYPIVEAYKDYVAVGWHANFSDPMFFHELGLDASITPQSGLPDAERLHVTARYKRYDLALAFRWNPASFYDLVGPTMTSRKGYGSSLAWHRSLLYDKPRSMEWTVDLSHWGGLERLPENQNIATPPGFDQLFTASTGVDYKNLRTSMGAPDFVKGVEAWASLSESGVRYVESGKVTWRGYPFVDGGFSVGHPLPVLRNSSLWLRSAAGFSPANRDDAFANFYFGGFGNNVLDYREPKRYRDPYSFPGTEIDAVAGTNYGRAMLDWNLPALRFRRGGTLAMYASWARVSFFGGGLATNFDDPGARRKLANLGTQVDIRLQLLTQAQLTLSLGYAQVFENHEKTSHEGMVSLKIL